MQAIAYYLALPFIYMLAIIPYPLFYGVCDITFVFLYSVFGYRKKVVRANLKNAFPHKTEKELRSIERKFYRYVCDLPLETFKTLVFTKQNAIKHCRMNTDTEKLFRNYEAQKKSIIVVLGHFGNWELMAALVTRRGYPASVVATPVYDPRLDRLLVDARARHGVHTISRGSPSAARHLLSGLRRNAILGMLIDQDTDVDGVFVPFFGRAAYTPSGPAALALKTGAAVIFGFILREGASRHRLILQGPIELIRTGDPARDIQENTARFTREIEQWIRSHPDHWVWMHNRWKRQPPAGDRQAFAESAGPSSAALPSLAS